MVKIDGYDIQLSRGDSLFLRIDLAGRDLPDGVDAVFSVKKNVKSDEVLIQKRVNASDEVVSVLLSSRETDLLPGVYYWDLRLLIPLPTGGYGVETPMDYAAFVVTEVVGDRVVDETDSETLPELPAIQAILAEMRLAIQNADEAVARVAEAAQSRAPYIGDNQNWWLWNNLTGAYEDSGVAAVAKPESVELLNAHTLDGKVPEYYLQPIDLLDNSAFQVAQAGYGSYHGARRYIADRWLLGHGGDDVHVVHQNGVTTLANAAEGLAMVVQRLSDEALAKIPNGTPLTIAVCCSDDSVLTANISYDDPDVSGVVLDSARIGHGWSINLYQGIGEARPYVRMYTDVLNETISFKWVRLLLGSYTAETLPPYVPRSYAAELAECMRYYQIVPKRIAATVSADGRAPITYAYPVVMQINPTLFKDAGDSVEVDIYGVGKKLGNITNMEVKARYCYLMLTLESEHQHKICTTTENLVLSADL